MHTGAGVTDAIWRSARHANHGELAGREYVRSHDYWAAIRKIVRFCWPLLRSTVCIGKSP
jgi:hypothetical protein